MTMSAPDRESLARHLADVEYPCGREELLRRCAAAGGGDELLGPLAALPDEHYRDLDTVVEAISATRTGRD
ncbi:DUF2795 domain-containing protein [Amycolatopsis sp. NPDC059027]|uniref:DUF2795 domain-containing protein n=1 Tax=unclassified Amycolatopsis TaxID=2618356 RepID=UPI00366F5C68